MALSRKWLDAEPLVEEALRIVGERGDCLGHGLIHVRKVAIDVGALILIEEGGRPLMHAFGGLSSSPTWPASSTTSGGRRRTTPSGGADEAAGILVSFPLRDEERAGVAGAIRNHEAFRPFRNEAGPMARLLADALYDADKFRWGPDNFTETLWAMITPAGFRCRRSCPNFSPVSRGVRKVRESFRTATGREYGPDFIDRGLTIGRRLYEELTADIK